MPYVYVASREEGEKKKEGSNASPGLGNRLLAEKTKYLSPRRRGERKRGKERKARTPLLPRTTGGCCSNPPGSREGGEGEERAPLSWRSLCDTIEDKRGSPNLFTSLARGEGGEGKRGDRPAVDLLTTRNADIELLRACRERRGKEGK